MEGYEETSIIYVYDNGVSRYAQKLCSYQLGCYIAILGINYELFRPYFKPNLRNLRKHATKLA
jgi:hypothetical protein